MLEYNEINSLARGKRSQAQLQVQQRQEGFIAGLGGQRMGSYSEKTLRLEGFLLRVAKSLDIKSWGVRNLIRYQVGRGFWISWLRRILAKTGLCRSNKVRMDREGHGWDLAEERAQRSLNWNLVKGRVFVIIKCWSRFTSPCSGKARSQHWSSLRPLVENDSYWAGRVPMLISDPITMSSVMCHSWSSLLYVSSPVSGKEPHQDHTENRRRVSKGPEKGKHTNMPDTQNLWWL